MRGDAAARGEDPPAVESHYRELWSRLTEGRRLPRAELDRWHEIERLVARVEERRAADGEPAAERRRALDLGCGRGWITRLLADRLDGWEVRGVDPLAASVEIARAQHPGLDIRRATGRDLLQLGETGTYDLVVASEVIEHVPYGDQDAFLAQALELLRPGGHLLLTTPRGEQQRRWRRSGRRGQPVEDWLTEPQLVTRVSRAGFEVVECSRVHPPTRPLTWQGWVDKWLLGRRYVSRLPLGALRRRLQHAAAMYQVLLLVRPAAAPEAAAGPATHAAAGPAPRISVVVCTRNRADLLREVLDDLRRQLPPTGCEVLVVDNGSTDHTARVVAELAGDDRFRRVEESELGLSRARNHGWREARGAYVAYTDDDCRIPPGWLEVAAEVIERHRPDVFGGPIDPFFQSPPPPWFRPAYLTRSRGDAARRLGLGENLWGGNLFVRRELLDEVGGFPTHLGMVDRRIAYGEETALQRSLSARRPGAVAYYEPRLRLRHLERPEKLRAGWLVRRFVAKGRDVYLAAAGSTPAPSRMVLLADLARTLALLVGQAILRLFVRDRQRFPYYQNFLYESASRYLRRIGRLGAQMRQPR